MIGTYDIELSAYRPDRKLPDGYHAFVGSAGRITLRSVPRKIGTWELTGVSVAITFPDNSITTCTCTQNGNVWWCQVPACSVTGNVTLGLKVIGTDSAANTYTLGVADVYIHNADGTIVIDGQSYTVSAGQILRATEEDGVYELVSLAEATAVIANYNKAKIGALPESHTIKDLENALANV